jgi:hypothetical protein
MGRPRRPPAWRRASAPRAPRAAHRRAASPRARWPCADPEDGVLVAYGSAPGSGAARSCAGSAGRAFTSPLIRRRGCWPALRRSDCREATIFPIHDERSFASASFHASLNASWLVHTWPFGDTVNTRLSGSASIGKSFVVGIGGAVSLWRSTFSTGWPFANFWYRCTPPPPTAPPRPPMIGGVDDLADALGREHALLRIHVRHGRVFHGRLRPSVEPSSANCLPASFSSVDFAAFPAPPFMSPCTMRASGSTSSRPAPMPYSAAVPASSLPVFSLMSP